MEATKLKIKDHNGLALAGVLHEPAGPGHHPLVILLHGFTGWKEEEHLATLADDLAAAGIAALRFDAPGSGESDGTWAENYTLTKYMSDVPDVLAYAKANLPIYPQRVGIWGHSMGGFIALATAARSGHTYKAVCGCQPSNGWKMLSDHEDKVWRTTGWSTFSNSRFPEIKLPYAFYKDRQQYNALKEVPNLKVPVLLIAGTKDDLVPVAGVKAMFAAAPEPKTYLEFPTWHDYKRDPAMLNAINEPTVKFFREHLA